MKEPRIEYIELLGRKYPMCLSNSAAEEIEDAFGSLSNIGSVLSNEDGKPIHALNQLIEILMAAGRRYAAVAGLDCPEPLPCRPADIINMSDPETMQELVQLISAVIVSGSSREVEAQIKNRDATQGE